MESRLFHGHNPKRECSNPYGRRKLIPKLASTAVLMYGTYRLASWWIQQRDNDDSDDHGHEQAQGSRDTEEEVVGKKSPHRGKDSISARISSAKSILPSVSSVSSWVLRTVTGISLDDDEFLTNDYHDNGRQKNMKIQMRKSQLETVSTLSNFLPTMQSIIEKQTKTTFETRELKRIRRQKQKVKSSSTAASSTNNIQDSTSNNNISQYSEQELWDKIKIKTMTRLLSSLYGHTLLYMVLIVQIHLLCGRIYYLQDVNSLDNNMATSVGTPPNESEFDNDTSNHQHHHTSKVHKMVLTKTYDYFFTKGLPMLIEAIQESASHRLQDWHVLQTSAKEGRVNASGEQDVTVADTSDTNEECDTPSNDASSREENEKPSLGFLSEIEMDDALNQIRKDIEEHPQNKDSDLDITIFISNLIQFVIPQEKKSNEDCDDNESGNGIEEDVKDQEPQHLANFILDETWDILESPQFSVAEHHLLNETFRMLKEDGWGLIFHEPLLLSSENASAALTSADEGIPIANVITKLKKVVNTFYEVNQRDTEFHDEWLLYRANDNRYPNIYVESLERVPILNELRKDCFHFAS